mgnify:CR=1 FL=1
MDERLSVIFKRRSIRAYTGDPVSEADVEALLQAGMAAPSASNRKPWHLVAVTDRTVLRALADAHPHGKMLAQAGLAIAVCGDPAISDFWVQDCTAATRVLVHKNVHDEFVAALAAHAFQIVSFEHGKNREKSVPNYERASVSAD